MLGGRATPRKGQAQYVKQGSFKSAKERNSETHGAASGRRTIGSRARRRMFGWTVLNNCLIVIASFIAGAMLSLPLGRLISKKPTDGFALILPLPQFDASGSSAHRKGLLDFSNSEKPSISSAVERSSATWKDVPGKADDHNRPLPLPSRGKVSVASMASGASDAFRIYTHQTEQRQSIGVCRFPTSCLDTQGILYVPQAFKKFRTSIASKCGLSKERMAFFDPANDGEMKDKEMTRYHPGTHIAGSFKPLRFHMPHLVEDLLRNIFVVAPYLQRKPARAEEAHEYALHEQNTTVYCFDSGSSSWSNKPYPCGSEPPEKVGVLVEGRAAKVNWTAGLFDLLGSPYSRAPLQLIYSNDAFAPYPVMNKEQKEHDDFLKRESGGRKSLFKPRRACFSSISIPGVSPGRFRKHGEVLNNVLLQHSGIQQKLPTVSTTETCSLNVTIINRPKRTENSPPWFAEPRRIVNVVDLEKELHKQAGRLGLSIKIENVEDLGELPFREQFQIMQRTQSLISIHGAELSNSIFLRKGTAVVEIYPFRYTPNIFAVMMQSFGVLQKTIIADPDERAYKGCLEVFNKVDSPSREETEKNIEIFNQRAKIFRDAKKDGNYQALGTHWDSSNFIKMVRPCARGQSLHIDPEFVARKALMDSKQLCYGTTEDVNKR